MTYPAPPIKSERVSFPPGTNWGIIEGDDEAEYLSDQDIAAGRIPNNTRTNRKYKKETKISSVEVVLKKKKQNIYIISLRGETTTAKYILQLKV